MDTPIASICSHFHCSTYPPSVQHHDHPIPGCFRLHEQDDLRPDILRPEPHCHVIASRCYSSASSSGVRQSPQHCRAGLHSQTAHRQRIALAVAKAFVPRRAIDHYLNSETAIASFRTWHTVHIHTACDSNHPRPEHPTIPSPPSRSTPSD